MSTLFNRIIQFTLILGIDVLCTVTVHAATNGATNGATPPEDETSVTHANRYGRGYESRQGLERGDREGRIERSEQIEHIVRPDRIDRLEGIERPGRGR